LILYWLTRGKSTGKEMLSCKNYLNVALIVTLDVLLINYK